MPKLSLIIRLLISTIFIQIVNTGSSQEILNYSILIESSSSNGQRYKTTIVRESDYITIYDNKHLGISKKGEKKFIRLFEKKKIHEDLSKEKKDEYNKKLKDTFEKYSRYEKDTITFGILENEKYTNTIDNIFTTETDILNWNRTNKDRFVLDGTNYTISVFNDGNIIKKIHSHSPTKQTFPELYTLISETKKIRLKPKNR